MEKLVIVIYFNIGYLDNHEISQVAENITERLEKSDDILYFIVPSNEYRIECINPKLVSEDDYKEAKLKLEETKLVLDNFINTYKNN